MEGEKGTIGRYAAQAWLVGSLTLVPAYAAEVGNFCVHTYSAGLTCEGERRTGHGARARDGHPIIQPASGDTYYMIVPRNSEREGSYGLDDSGFERRAAASPCLPQWVQSTCP